MSEPLTLYKLIILYMLEKGRFSPYQCSDFRLCTGQRLHKLFSFAAGNF